MERNDPGPKGVHGELNASACAGFAQGVRDMRVYGAFRDLEMRGDLRVAEAVHH
jgi:hypothetical protein